ncbi:MAG: N-formylglutamate amidohydrolase [Myxococcales bacterium]|nr:N-formylglutamate amidohydrolase [Myxococcales bacterium]MDH3483241.1 N-formylglutamate amidohydrolase [Myxococcales bacterium]
MKTQALLLTCEHGGARVPPEYRYLFASSAARAALQSHRARDLGALGLAQSLQRALRAPLHASTVTRLLVDLNRSIGHPQLFSKFSKSLDRAERATLLDRHYFPHRDGVESWIEGRVRRGRQVLHIGVHSFVPRVEGRKRKADVGLLYDPARAGERAFCAQWKEALEAVDPKLRVRRNYPYLGKSDGLVTHLRRAFGPRGYVGIELEVNQALLGEPHGRRRAMESIRASLASLVDLNAGVQIDG